MNNYIAGVKQLIKYLKSRLIPKRTYAQCNEDLVIQMILGKVLKFIDIGAFNGITLSNTFLFARKGARGLCFEPLFANYFRLKWFYCLNKRIKCIGEGISDKQREVHITGWSYIPSIVNVI